MYLKKDSPYIPDGLQQIFYYVPSPTTSISGSKLCELRLKGFIKDDEMEVIKILFDFTMAAPEQLLLLSNFETEKELRKSLDRLVKQRVLNKFCLGEDERIYNDNEYDIYTIDLGGAQLLQHFYNGEDYVNWRTEDIIVSSIKVAKYLSLIDFYIRLLESCPKKLKMFEVRPKLSLGYTKITPHFALCLTHGGKDKFFVGSFVFSNDIDMFALDGDKYREQALRIESLLTTNAWRKSYGNEIEPTYLIIAEDDEVASRAAGIVSTTQIPNFRLTTISRLKKKLSDSGAFLAYKEDKLIPVKNNVFIDC